MATLKKYDIVGNQVGTVEVHDDLLAQSAHPQSIKDYIVALRNNARQWSASTKTRAEINRTGRKPHPQKGQGRSRQGDLAAPQYKGGGIVFGPRPKFDIHVRINKKERQAAIRSILVEKIKENRVCVLEKGEFSVPKTKRMAQFFETISHENKRVLVLGQGKSDVELHPHEALFKSVRNIPKKECVSVRQLNGYVLARCQEIVVLDSAIDELLVILGAS